MRDDEMEIEILEDGTIKLTTGVVGPANHRNADELLVFLAKLMGGDRKVARRKEAHAHSHGHGHRHSH